MLPGFTYQTSFDRILFDIELNPLKLRPGSYQVIVARPAKWATVATEQLIRPMGGKPFQRPQPARSNELWSNQNVYVIRHHDVRMQLLVAKFPLSIVQGLNHHFRDLRAA
jgi:hypothetical protein